MVQISLKPMTRKPSRNHCLINLKFPNISSVWHIFYLRHNESSREKCSTIIIFGRLLLKNVMGKNLNEKMICLLVLDCGVKLDIHIQKNSTNEKIPGKNSEASWKPFNSRKKSGEEKEQTIGMVCLHNKNMILLETVKTECYCEPTNWFK